MRLPINWLRDYLDLDLDASALAELLVGLGIEIEEIVEAGELGGEVLVAEITPNRGDCLSIQGLAREIAAKTGASLRLPATAVTEAPDQSIAGQVAVTIEAPDLCPRYAARLVGDLTIGPSPAWMQQRLVACGQRPVNVIVDVTNFVLFEMGQPLHAFDADLLGPTIVVRRARDGEVLVTLDDVKRTLTADQLVICDADRPVALAGVMGGANTEISESTRQVVLEAAHFHGPNIRRTARSLGLESESSYRFARVVDPSLPVLALDRAAALLAELAGATVATGVIDERPRPIEPRTIRLRPSRCNSFLGTDLAPATMAGHLTALGFEVSGDDTALAVTVPTRRPDLEREVDLIEEVARLHGYNEVPTTVPPAAGRTGRRTPRQRREQRVRELLLGLGLNEVWTFSLTSPEAMRRAGYEADLDAIGAVRLRNALSDDFSVMRWSMLPSMVETVARNAALHAEPVRFFEIGRTYAGLDPAVSDATAAAAGRVATGQTATTLPRPCTEELNLGGALVSAAYSSNWNLPAERLQADFYEAKGILERIAAELQLPPLHAEPHQEPIFVHGRAARLLIGDQVVAVLGEVSAEVLQRFDLSGPVVIFEANLGWMLDAADDSRQYQPVQRHPAVLRDLALLVPDTVPASDVTACIEASAGPWLGSLALFDVYRGKGVDDGCRSLAYSLTFRDPKRTLTDREVDSVVQRIVSVLHGEFDARLRE